ncbi:hypothetical protein DENSPDRAFT_875126 [Dentipellis sp. KUC8613]|nr:hypothetical protein DENSPDRAFT_875126 [Dentipellis sp. KUC8613]
MLTVDELDALFLQIECQLRHWDAHKQDCKDPVRSDSWAPSWVAENRDFSFAGKYDERIGDRWQRLSDSEFSDGQFLWGNVPAMNIVNLPNNEDDSTIDLSLAFAASGDIRNVVKTVNELPTDYSGHLTILLNDLDPYIAVRNLAILLVLGQVPDEKRAVDVALHLWYSVYVPKQHPVTVINTVLPAIKRYQVNGTFSEALGPTSTLSAIIPPKTMNLLHALVKKQHDMQEINAEIERIRFEPSREDLHHRKLCKMKPSNRLAFHRSRRSGVVLPFGARSDEFNFPNPFLFSHDGKWLQNEAASPLDSWNLEEVVKIGSAHGAQSEDIFGCLYFFLTEQLTLFSRRLKQFRISFQLLNDDATALPTRLRSGALAPVVPADAAFDRIDVSNLLDDVWAGSSPVLQAWGPLLKGTNYATIVGYFMNWVEEQPGGYVNAAGGATTSALLEEMLRQGKMYPDLSKIPAPNKMLEFQKIMAVAPDYLAMLYDNSGAFEEFLTTQDISEILRKAILQRKETHTVVPHRLAAPLGAPRNALPFFPTDESWYFQVQMGCWHGSERFLEFCRR